MVSRYCLKQLLAAIAVLLFLSSCEGTSEFANTPPSNITITRSKCTTWTGGEINFVGDAEDGDGDPLTFTWSANAGAFLPPNGNTGENVTWKAPDLPGGVIITLKVSDGIDDRSLSVSVDVGEEFPQLIHGEQQFTDNGYPYVLTNLQPVSVSVGSILTIGPGVTLVVDAEFGGLDVRGTLAVEGDKNNMVNIGPNSCSGISQKWGGIYLSGASASCTLKNVNMYKSTDGIQINQGATATIDSCNITDTDDIAISLLYGSSAAITNCKIWDNGGGIFVVNSDVTLRSSSLRYNADYGFSAEVITDIGTTYDMLVEDCLIANNGHDGITLVGSARPEIHYNALYFNEPEVGVGYAVKLMSYTGSDSIHAEENYWGATTQPGIEEQIYDAQDDPEEISAYVGFIPWLPAEPLAIRGREPLRGHRAR